MNLGVEVKLSLNKLSRYTYLRISTAGKIFITINLSQFYHLFPGLLEQFFPRLYLYLFHINFPPLQRNLNLIPVSNVLEMPCCTLPLESEPF